MCLATYIRDCVDIAPNKYAFSDVSVPTNYMLARLQILAISVEKSTRANCFKFCCCPILADACSSL